MCNMYLVGIFLVILIGISSNEIIKCDGSDCDCPPTASPGTKCILECDQVDICKNQTLTCRDGDPCEIHCNQKASCSSSYIDGYMASDVTIICSAEDACRDNIEISCGNGQCLLECDGDTSCLNWGYINVNRSQSFRCIGDCPNDIPPSFYHHQLAPTSLPTASHTNASYTQSISSHVATMAPTFVPSPDKTAQWDSGSIPTINGIDIDPIFYVTFILIIAVFYVCCILCGWVYFHSRNTKKLMEKQIKKMESKSRTCSFHKHSSCSVHQLNLPVTPSNKSHVSIQYANSSSYQPQLDLNKTYSNAHSEYLSNDENTNILSPSNARSIDINRASVGDTIAKQSASETSIEPSSSSSLTVDVIIDNENVRVLSPKHTDDISDMFVHVPDGPPTPSKPYKQDSAKSNTIWIPPAPSKSKRSKSRRSELTDPNEADISMLEPKKSRSLPPPPPRIVNNNTHQKLQHHIQYLRKQTDYDSVDNQDKLSFANYPSLPMSDTHDENNKDITPLSCKSESMTLDDIKLEPGAGPIMQDISIGSGLAITHTRRYTSIPSVPTLPNASHSIDAPIVKLDPFASPKVAHLAPPSADSEQHQIGNSFMNAIITGNLRQLEEGEDSKTETVECFDNGALIAPRSNVIDTTMKLATLNEENSHHMEDDMSAIAKDINLILHAVRTDEGIMNGLELDPEIDDVDATDIFGKISTKY